MAAFMDELVIDPVSGEQITPKHAVLVPLVQGEFDVVEYLKSVGSIIGAKNIRSGYKEGSHVKVYLRYLKHVEEVVNGGVLFRDRHVNVKYVVPPATEVLLKNVDTEIPNAALTSSLENYGDVLTKITTDKVDVDDPEFSHVESNTRRVYLQIKSHVTVPHVLHVKHSNKDYSIDVCVAENVPSESHRYSLPDVSSPSDETPEVKRTRMLEDDSLKSPSENSVHVRSVGRRGRGSFKGRKFHRSGSNFRDRMDSGKQGGLRSKVSQLALVGKSSAASKSSAANLVSSSDADSPAKTNAIASVNSVESNGITSKPPDSEMKDPAPEKLNSSFDSEKFGESAQYPFSLPTLQQFLRDVKNLRNPREVALNMLEENNTPGAVDDLCQQLSAYYECCGDHSLKYRISRLLQIFTNDEKA